eukprot:gene27954-1655_t
MPARAARPVTRRRPPLRQEQRRESAELVRRESSRVGESGIGAARLNKCDAGRVARRRRSDAATALDAMLRQAHTPERSGAAAVLQRAFNTVRGHGWNHPPHVIATITSAAAGRVAALRRPPHRLRLRHTAKAPRPGGT